jgi:hypothetical protein
MRTLLLLFLLGCDALMDQGRGIAGGGASADQEGRIGSAGLV